MRDLPKWTQMLVRGASISPERVLEVIRRTDSFFTQEYGGNDREWDDQVRRMCGMPSSDYDRHTDWNARELHRQAFRTFWQTVQTEYVCNRWISSPFVFGPNGWCHPDGRIEYHHNVGKWPDVEDIQADWTALAEAFPFLRLDALCMSGESSEEDTHPVVGFVVRDGTVAVHAPDQYEFFHDFPHAVDEPRNMTAEMDTLADQLQQPARVREHSILLDQIKSWACIHNPYYFND